ncbi:Polynucleotidyl transferase ribonuclease H-like superfamily protein [Euphorbia peplus]|nr:Polynucleotidyl transferase ribonuclease H-like superfamily protein [Euphorbia peplus]
MLDPQINGEKPEIAFFDVETTVPTRPGQGFALLEFGSILVCPRKLEELRSYSTLVRPSNPSLISALSVRCNGITPDSVESAPSFLQIADTVYDILNGRIWAGHNILRFDCPRIKEAFAHIGRPPPEPKGIIDSLALLTQKFGRRAGDMKMASLATYFGLGKQKHRSLDDVRMNLEVLKYCATVLFLESSFPESFPEKSWVSPNAITRSRTNGKSSPEGPVMNTNAPSSSSNVGNISPPDDGADRNASFLSAALTSVASNTAQADPFDMRTLSCEMNTESLEDVSMEEKTVMESSLLASSMINQEGCNGCPGFLEPDQVNISSIKVAFVPFFRGTQKMVLLHRDVPLQLYCHGLRVRFGISSKFTDYAGRPRLSFVVEPSPSLCEVLEACDRITQEVSAESGNSSEWRHVLNKRQSYVPTIRLNIPTRVNEDNVAQFGTEIYQKDASGSKQKLVFSTCDAAELDTWLSPRTILDACFTLEPYDFHQMAGIRLVAKQLIVHQE